jgi:hypothetical protein
MVQVVAPLRAGGTGSASKENGEYEEFFYHRLVDGFNLLRPPTVHHLEQTVKALQKQQPSSSLSSSSSSSSSRKINNNNNRDVWRGYDNEVAAASQRRTEKDKCSFSAKQPLELESHITTIDFMTVTPTSNTGSGSTGFDTGFGSDFGSGFRGHHQQPTVEQKLGGIDNKPLLPPCSSQLTHPPLPLTSSPRSQARKHHVPPSPHKKKKAPLPPHRNANKAMKKQQQGGKKKRSGRSRRRQRRRMTAVSSLGGSGGGGGDGGGSGNTSGQVPGGPSLRLAGITAGATDEPLAADGSLATAGALEAVELTVAEALPAAEALTAAEALAAAEAGLLGDERAQAVASRGAAWAAKELTLRAALCYWAAVIDRIGELQLKARVLQARRGQEDAPAAFNTGSIGTATVMTPPAEVAPRLVLDSHARTTSVPLEGHACCVCGQ